MALITLRRNICHFSDVWMPGAVATLKNQPASYIHKVARDRLSPWFCSQRPEPFKVRFHHACCKNFHSENGNDLHPVGEPALSQVRDWDQLEQSFQKESGQVFDRRLKDFTSSEEVLSFISTLGTLPEPVAAAALRRICEVENRDGGQNLTQAIRTHRVFQALCLRFEQEASRLSDTGLLTALQALSMLRLDPQSSLILSLVAECQDRLKRGGLGAHHLCILGESLVRLQDPGCVTLERILYQLQSARLETLAAEDIVAIYKILQACPEKVDRHQSFLNRVNRVSLSVVPYLSPTSISEVLRALVVLDQTHALPLVLKLGRYVVRHVPHFTSEELRNVLEALTYFGYSDRFLTKALEQHVAGLRLSVDWEVASKVMDYCSRKEILSKPILDVAAETFIRHSEKLSPGQIYELIEPFGKLNYSPPNAPAVFRKLENVLFTRFNYFPPKTLLRLLHACSLIEYHPVNFMAKIFSPFFLQRLQGEEPYLDRLSLALVTQLFLTSILECPFYKGPKLLPKYQVKSFLTPCCSLEIPMDFRLYKSVVVGLIDLLGARWYFASKVLTPYCYTIDIEIKLDEEGFVLPFTVDEDVHKRVALCIDGPKRFCYESTHLLGKEVIKRRHLQLLGYQVVQVPYHEVEALRSRLELVEYLQRKLFAQNSIVRW
uniref:FAST kinase domains 3 n=1 Tax=Jaculus jaculus TaxID=51337 RepID=A0A8C5L7I9_JACJA|nr:FAST kinase domain-containing protein 3, mitochondrial [Jaculus jaculus]